MVLYALFETKQKTRVHFLTRWREAVTTPCSTPTPTRYWLVNLHCFFSPRINLITSFPPPVLTFVENPDARLNRWWRLSSWRRFSLGLASSCPNGGGALIPYILHALRHIDHHVMHPPTHFANQAPLCLGRKLPWFHCVFPEDHPPSQQRA